MIYNIICPQKALYDVGLSGKISADQVNILMTVSHLAEQHFIRTKEDERGEWFWVSPKLVADELIGMGYNTRKCYREMLALTTIGLIERHEKNQAEAKMYVRFTDLFLKMEAIMHEHNPRISAKEEVYTTTQPDMTTKESSSDLDKKLYRSPVPHGVRYEEKPKSSTIFCQGSPMWKPIQNFVDSNGNKEEEVSISNSQIQNTAILPLTQQTAITPTATIGYKQQPRKEENSFPALPETPSVVSRTTPPETTNTNSMEQNHLPAENLTQESSVVEKPKGKQRKVSNSSGGASDNVAKRKTLSGYQGTMCSMINQLRASKPEYGFINELGLVDQQPFGGREAKSAKSLYLAIEARINANNAQAGIDARADEMDVLNEFKELMFRCTFVMSRTKSGYLKRLFDLNYISSKYPDILAESRALGFNPVPKVDDPLKPQVERGFTPANFGERLRAMLDTNKIDKATAKAAFEDYKERYMKLFPAKY